MERFDGFLYERFEFFYTNSLVINYSAINPSKAIDILLELTQKEKMDKLHFQGVFVYLNLAVLYHMNKDYDKSLRYLSRLYSYEDFKNTEPLLQLRITIGELMMRYDMNDFDTLEYRIKQINKNYREQIEDLSNWEGEFINFIKEMTNNELKRNKKSFQFPVRELLERIQSTNDVDNMLFKYDEWLVGKAKMV